MSAQLLRLLAAVFATLEVETSILKGAAVAAATAEQQPHQQQQLLLQVQQQVASPLVLEVGLGVVSLVAKAYLFRERLSKPVLADLLLPGMQTLSPSFSNSEPKLLWPNRFNDRSSCFFLLVVHLFSRLHIKKVFCCSIYWLLVYWLLLFPAVCFRGVAANLLAELLEFGFCFFRSVINLVCAVYCI